MPGDTCSEARLRELLRDPGWSVPPRPDAPARVRRAARRQRARAVGLAACAAAIAAAIAVPLALPGRDVQGGPVSSGHTSTSSAGPHSVANRVMPNVTGQEVREAKVIIRAALPGAHVIVQQASSADLPGEVIAQFPAAGSRIPPGAPITLVVSAGPR